MVAVHSDLAGAAYEDLRKRLIDKTRRNRLLHFPHPIRASIVRVVDAALEPVFTRLSEAGRFRFRPLPDPDGEPADERTPMFQAVLAKARLSDGPYRAELAKVDPHGPSAATAEARLERALRDQVRDQMALPPRPPRPRST